MSSSQVLPELVVHNARIEPRLARSIRLVCFDVDGVLTDGGVYLGSASSDRSAGPMEFKRYDIQDGLGIVMLRSVGLATAIITGRVSESVALRARELRVDACIQDPHARKLPALIKLCDERGISLDEVAFVGDDLTDLAVLRSVGLPVAVGNAVAEVLRASKLRLTRTGGHGAVREFAEILLQARGEWIDAVERFVKERSESPPDAVDSLSDSDNATVSS